MVTILQVRARKTKVRFDLQVPKTVFLCMCAVNMVAREHLKHVLSTLSHAVSVIHSIS